ncbi:MAG TPA: hypothetical protein VE870_07050 [Bacteroidales bacterium]|nr:hypothetical protein [Bacteroidales bacterium]
MYNSRLYARYDYDTKIYDIDVRYYAIRIPLLFGYTLPGTKLRPKFSVGLNSVLLPGREFAASRYVPENDIEFPVNDDRFTGFHFGLTLGTEFMYKVNEKLDLKLGLAYERRAPASNFRHLMDYQVIHSLAVNFGASFTISKK